MFGASRAGGLAQKRQQASRDDAEDASTGRLGAEFNETDANRNAGGALTISEVRLLLDRHRDESVREEEPNARDPMSMPVFQKCHEYVEMFSRFKDEDTVRKVRQELMAHDREVAPYDDEGRPIPEDQEPEDSESLKLTRFEMAQLANLSIEDVEEAKTLIPTLQDKDHQKLEVLINELATRRKFGS